MAHPRCRRTLKRRIHALVDDDATAEGYGNWEEALALRRCEGTSRLRRKLLVVALCDHRGSHHAGAGAPCPNGSGIVVPSQTCGWQRGPRPGHGTGVAVRPTTLGPRRCPRSRWPSCAWGPVPRDFGPARAGTGWPGPTRGHSRNSSRKNRWVISGARPGITIAANRSRRPRLFGRHVSGGVAAATAQHISPIIGLEGAARGWHRAEPGRHRRHRDRVADPSAKISAVGTGLRRPSAHVDDRAGKLATIDRSSQHRCSVNASAPHTAAMLTALG